MKKSSKQRLSKEIKCSDFESYRDWLAKLYERFKQHNDTYSYPEFSLDLGLSASNAYLIITNKRNLSKKSAAKVIKELGLAAREGKYLTALIEHEKSLRKIAKENSFEKLVASKKSSLDDDLSRKQLSFFEDWYNAAILELLGLKNSKDDPEWIANHLSSKVSINNINKSLNLLKELGYLDMNHGCLRPTKKIISTGDEIASVAVASYHHQMIDLAKDSIYGQKSSKREISALTISIPEEQVAELRSEIIAFRKKLVKLCNNSSEPKNEIMQINMQMFSLGSVEEE